MNEWINEDSYIMWNMILLKKKRFLWTKEDSFGWASERIKTHISNSNKIKIIFLNSNKNENIKNKNKYENI